MWNMAFKDRIVSDELKKWRSLHARMVLTEEERKYYLNKEKGFEGELRFDELTEKLTGDQIILNDLLLEVNGVTFQIDTTIIFQDTIDLFEVKNYEGDYLFKQNRFYINSELEILNPLDQLKRCQTLFRQLLQNLSFKIPVEGRLIFINPEFTLYNAPENKSIIFPTQINRFMKKLNSKPSKVNGTHKKLAEQLVSMHQTKSKINMLPNYEYHQPQMGISCASCHSLMTSVKGTKLICNVCGVEEKLESAVMRSVWEFKLLFPDKKITTNSIFDWCKVVPSKPIIRRILQKNMKSIGIGQWSYYEF
jgi:hypothetical protein